MRSQQQFFDISLACDLVRESVDQVLEQCASFSPQLSNADTLLQEDSQALQRSGKLVAPSFFDTFDEHVGFDCHFKLQDYQAFCFVGVQFVNNTAVECIISLGRPANPEQYGSELEVTKVFLVSLEELYGNGRIQEETEPGTRVYTWKRDDTTVVSFVSYPPSGSPQDTGARLGVQIRDTEIHPDGAFFELLYNGARESVQGVKHVMLHRKDEPLERVYEGRSGRYHLTAFVMFLAIGLGIGGITSLVSKNLPLGTVLIVSALVCALLVAKLDSKARRDFRQKKER